MMNRSLEHYAIKFDNFLDKQTCEDAIEQQKNAKFQQHMFYDSKNNSYNTRSGNKELDVTWDKLPVTNNIMKKLWQAIKDYQNKLSFPWFVKWDGYTQIRFNKYSESREMALHCDHIKSIFEGKRKGIPTLSCLGTLNDNYEGGEFVMWDNKVIPFKAGDLLIFPSNFMYPHKVKPVTKGTRYSYISWVW